MLKGKSVLDVGTRDGKNAFWFAENGYEVDAVDIAEVPESTDSINFVKQDIADFLASNSKKYDITLARHVLPFVENPKEVLESLKGCSKTIFFTVFGAGHEWANKVKTMEMNEVMQMFKGWDIVHRSESFEYSKTYSGDTAYFHTLTFVVTSKD